MRDLRRRSLRSASLASAFGLGALLALLASPAQAITIPLSFEFDDGTSGNWGEVRITENGSGGLFFEVETGPALGPDPDLHYFYFNFVGTVDDLAISSDDAVFTDYSLDQDESVRGGAGSRFEYSVFFGNGGGQKGNGRLELATFTLFSEGGTPLSLLQLAELSETAGGLESLFAVHVQNTGPRGGGSETIGGNAIIPEPTTFGLMAGGLVGLAIIGRRRVPPAPGPVRR